MIQHAHSAQAVTPDTTGVRCCDATGKSRRPRLSWLTNHTEVCRIELRDLLKARPVQY